LTGGNAHANFENLFKKNLAEVDRSFEDTGVNLSSITTHENSVSRISSPENLSRQRYSHRGMPILFAVRCAQFG